MPGTATLGAYGRVGYRYLPRCIQYPLHGTPAPLPTSYALSHVLLRYSYWLQFRSPEPGQWTVLLHTPDSFPFVDAHPASKAQGKKSHRQHAWRLAPGSASACRSTYGFGLDSADSAADVHLGDHV